MVEALVPRLAAKARNAVTVSGVAGRAGTPLPLHELRDIEKSEL